MQELVGHKILNVEVGNDEQVMRFTVENGEPFVYITEGDCCSETWFSEVINLDFIIH